MALPSNFTTELSTTILKTVNFTNIYKNISDDKLQNIMLRK